MELIFRIIDPAGRGHDWLRRSGSRITVGRAYDNDLILDDPTVSPYHAVFEESVDDGQALLRDLGSLNGISIQGGKQVGREIEIVSGTVYAMGKTRVCVYRPDHPVAETTRIGSVEIATELLERPLILLGVIILASLVYAANQWLNMFSGFEWQEVANMVLIVLGSTLALAIFWAVVGRILRHETHFRKQVTVILSFVVAQFLVSKFYELVLFNTLDFTISLVMLVAVELVLITLLLWFNLYLATNQPAFQRLRLSAVLAVVLVALSLYTEMVFRPDFSEAPDYVRLLEPPLLNFAEPVDTEEFLSDAAEVFSRLEDG